MKTNFNRHIYVSLTPAGKKRLLEYYENLASKDYDPLVAYASHDKFRFQLWDFVGIFGGDRFATGAMFNYCSGDFDLDTDE